MANLQIGRDFGAKLAAALGLPRETKSFELRCAADEVVTVRAEIFVTSESGDVEAVLREYELMLEQKNG